VADYLYGLPRHAPPPPPVALQLGLDWKEYKTPPCAGGLFDQPLELLKQIRLAMSTHASITAWRQAQNVMSAESFTKFCSAHPDLVTFMQMVWSLQEETDE
jgi:hypothetical protein